MQNDGDTGASSRDAQAAGRTGPEIDLRSLRACVDGADAVLLQPAELVQIVDGLRRATLDAIEAAERGGQADATLVRLDRAWRAVASRTARKQEQE